MRHIHRTPIRRRLAAAVSGLTMIGVLVAVPPAGAAYIVQSGGAVTIPFGSCSSPQLPVVVPPPAGSAVYNEDTTVTFTAAQDFAGKAVVRLLCAGFLAGEVELQVADGSGAADATFTPRPAPGPCITVELTEVEGSLPSSIDFGDVTVGTTKTSPTAARVTTCASIQQSVAATISDATTGSGDQRVTWEPSGPNDDLNPDEFRYALNFDGFEGGYNPMIMYLTNTPSVLRRLEPFGGAEYLFNALSTLTVAPGSSTGIGQQFTATLTFVAVKV